MNPMPMIHELVDYELLLDAVSSQNELEADALYWAERSAGEAEAMPDCYCPVRASAFQAKAAQLMDLAAVNRMVLAHAIMIFNEHDEFPVALEKDDYKGRWGLNVA